MSSVIWRRFRWPLVLLVTACCLTGASVHWQRQANQQLQQHTLHIHQQYDAVHRALLAMPSLTALREEHLRLRQQLAAQTDSEQLAADVKRMEQVEVLAWQQDTEVIHTQIALNWASSLQVLQTFTAQLSAWRLEQFTLRPADAQLLMELEWRYVAP